jgi:hypothetical protein
MYITFTAGKILTSGGEQVSHLAVLPAEKCQRVRPSKNSAAPRPGGGCLLQDANASRGTSLLITFRFPRHLLQLYPGGVEWYFWKHWGKITQFWVPCGKRARASDEWVHEEQLDFHFNFLTYSA